MNEERKDYLGGKLVGPSDAKRDLLCITYTTADRTAQAATKNGMGQARLQPRKEETDHLLAPPQRAIDGFLRSELKSNPKKQR